MSNEIKVTATFDDDTKRTHRFVIDDGQGVKGNLYFPRDKQVPDVVIIHLRTRADVEKEAADKA